MAQETLRHPGQVRLVKLRRGGVALHIVCLDGGVPKYMVDGSPAGFRDDLARAYSEGKRYAVCLETRSGVYARWRFTDTLSEAEAEADRILGRPIKKLKDKFGKGKLLEEEGEE
jgi:hypothetical protein